MILVLSASLLSSCSISEDFKQNDRKNKSITLYNSTVALINTGKFKRALPILQEAIAVDPGNMLAMAALGRVLIENGKVAEGLKCLEIVHASDPSNTALMIEMGYAYEKLGRFSKSIELFEAYQKVGREHREDLPPRLKALKEQQALFERIDKQPGARSRQDYLVFATYESGICRWKTRSTPLRVYIDRPKAIRGHQPRFEQLVLKALTSWEQASGGKIKFKQVSDSKRADIRCNFVDNPKELDSPIKEGETKTRYGLEGLTAANIKILTIDRRTREPQSDEEIHSTALHEIGHALGLLGHSPDARDIMFFSGGATEEMRELSSRDVATLKALYDTEKPYIPPKGSKLEKQVEHIRAYNEHTKLYNEAVHLFNSKHYDQAIEQANEFLKIEPKSDMAKELIELAYNRQALQLIEKGDFQTAETTLNLALTVTYTNKNRKARSVTKNNLKYLVQKKKTNTGSSASSSEPASN